MEREPTQRPTQLSQLRCNCRQLGVEQCRAEMMSPTVRRHNETMAYLLWGLCDQLYKYLTIYIACYQYIYVYRYVFRFQFEINIPFVSCSLLSQKIENNSQKNLATLRGVAGPHLFLAKVKMLKMFASNLFLSNKI